MSTSLIKHILLVCLLMPLTLSNQAFAKKIMSRQAPRPDVVAPVDNCAGKVPVMEESHVNDVSLSSFNIDFGPWHNTASTKIGAAVVGNSDDYWNTVTSAFNDDFTATKLKTSRKEPSPIEVRSINLGGAWGNDNAIRVKDVMYNDYNYPQYNQGGDSEVILRNVPEGAYDLYIYGHHIMANGYGDYELYVGGENLGRKNTSKAMDAIANSCWVEGSQYVRFAGINVKKGDKVNLVIYPGGKGMRSWSDTIINGLQLVPAGTPRIEYR